MITPHRSSGSKRKGRGPQTGTTAPEAKTGLDARNFVSPQQRKWLTLMYEYGYQRRAREWANIWGVHPYVALKTLKILELKGLAKQDAPGHYHLTDRAEPYLSAGASRRSQTARPSQIP